MIRATSRAPAVRSERGRASGRRAGRTAAADRAVDLSSIPRTRTPRRRSPTRSIPIEPKQLAAIVAHLADRKKGADIRIYDVAEHLKVADYFVLVSGTSRPHVKALYDEIHVKLKALGETHAKAEGADLGWWVLLDYVDVVVHILQPEAREYYALDALYRECPQVDLSKVTLPAGIDSELRMAE